MKQWKAYFRFKTINVLKQKCYILELEQPVARLMPKVINSLGTYISLSYGLKVTLLT